VVLPRKRGYAEAAAQRRRHRRSTGYIQREQDLEAHAVLTNPAGTQSISAIIEDLWLADAWCLIRAFKWEFGRSPEDMRSASRARLVSPVPPRGLAPSVGGEFGDLPSVF
jgi:hypothetical protein